MKPDYKYWKQLAAFAYGYYIDYGDGVVQIKEKPSQAFSPADMDCICGSASTLNWEVKQTGRFESYLLAHLAFFLFNISFYKNIKELKCQYCSN